MKLVVLASPTNRGFQKSKCKPPNVDIGVGQSTNADHDKPENTRSESGWTLFYVYRVMRGTAIHFCLLEPLLGIKLFSQGMMDRRLHICGGERAHCREFGMPVATGESATVESGLYSTVWNVEIQTVRYRSHFLTADNACATPRDGDALLYLRRSDSMDNRFECQSL